MSIAKYKFLSLLHSAWCLYIPLFKGYTAFLADGIYAQSIQSAQIGFGALNAINALHEISISCHNTVICVYVKKL